MDIAGKAKGPKRIGELLVAAKVIKKEVLGEALQIAKGSKTLIGRTLMGIGELKEADLQAALELQNLLKEGVVSMDFGVRALNLACQGHIPLDKAFQQLGWQPPKINTIPASSLGELLLEAGIVNRKLLTQVLEQSQESNLPLGRCLIVNCIISPALLSAALTAQVLLRDGKITKEQAIAGLRVTNLKHQSIEKSLLEAGSFGITLNEIKLGDLLSAAGVVAEGDKITAVEMSLQKKELVGQVLLRTAMVSQPVLADALKLQALVKEGKIAGPQATEFLKKSHETGVNVDVLLEERARKEADVRKTNELIEFLCLTDLVSEEEMEKAQMSARLGSGSTVGEVLVLQGLVDAQLLEAAAQAQVLLEEEMVPVEQIVSALALCKKTKVELPQALQDISWRINENSLNRKGSWVARLWSKVKRPT